jgi:hypothetical protein
MFSVALRRFAGILDPSSRDRSVKNAILTPARESSLEYLEGIFSLTSFRFAHQLDGIFCVEVVYKFTVQICA